MKINVTKGWGSQYDTIEKNIDPLDRKPVINHYGEPLWTLNGDIEATQTKLTENQRVYLGLKTMWVYILQDMLNATMF